MTLAMSNCNLLAGALARVSKRMALPLCAADTGKTSSLLPFVSVGCSAIVSFLSEVKWWLR